MGGQDAKFLVMTLCLGPGGQGLLWYLFLYAKGEKWGQECHGPCGSPGYATAYTT